MERGLAWYSVLSVACYYAAIFTVDTRSVQVIAAILLIRLCIAIAIVCGGMSHRTMQKTTWLPCMLLMCTMLPWFHLPSSNGGFAIYLLYTLENCLYTVLFTIIMNREGDYVPVAENSPTYQQEIKRPWQTQMQPMPTNPP